MDGSSTRQGYGHFSTMRVPGSEAVRRLQPDWEHTASTTQHTHTHTWDYLLVKWRIWSRDFLPLQGKCCKVSSALCQVCSTQRREMLCCNPVIAQSTAGRGFLCNTLLFMKWRKSCSYTVHIHDVDENSGCLPRCVCADFSDEQMRWMTFSSRRSEVLLIPPNVLK